MKKQKVGSEQDARALTAEIDRATEVAADRGADVVVGEMTTGERSESSEKTGADLERMRLRGERILGHSRADDKASNYVARVLDEVPTRGVASNRSEGVLDAQLAADRAAVELRRNEIELANATTELIDDEEELVEAQNFVGEETPLQVRERLAADREDYLTEIGKGSPRDFKIMTANAERLTDEAVTAVQHLIKEEAVHPANLAHIKHEMTVALLKDAYSRVFGDRN